MKPTHFALVCILMSATFCAAQSAPKPGTPDANQSTQPPATGTVQTPEPTPPPVRPPAAQPAEQSHDQDKDSAATSKDRLFFALPNFSTLEGASPVKPMTAGQKFKLVARSSFDPVQIPWYGFLAGISQAEDSEPGYGQGAEGYGKRFGAYAADGTIENFFVGGIFPGVLRQDPRFFQSGQGSFFHRTGYAVSRIVVTRGDSGHSQFNYSEVFGSAMASAISTYSYHPRRTFLGVRKDGSLRYASSARTLKNTASVWGSQVGYDTITLVIKEFWPDIRRKLKKQPH